MYIYTRSQFIKIQTFIYNCCCCKWVYVSSIFIWVSITLFPRYRRGSKKFSHMKRKRDTSCLVHIIENQDDETERDSVSSIRINTPIINWNRISLSYWFDENQENLIKSYFNVCTCTNTYLWCAPLRAFILCFISHSLCPPHHCIYLFISMFLTPSDKEMKENSMLDCSSRKINKSIRWWKLLSSDVRLKTHLNNQSEVF